MKSRSALYLLLLTVAGCGSDDSGVADARPDAPMPDASSSESKPAMQSFTPIPETVVITKAALEALEGDCSCQLPDDYSDFLISNNGTFPTLDCVSFEEAGHKTASDVFCFFALTDKRPSLSMEWHRNTYSERLPKDTLPIARDSSGNLWLLSLGDDAGTVYFWDHGSFDTIDETNLKNWPKVAGSFAEFRDSLCEHDPSFESGKIPSRYSLVAQAVDGMTRRDSAFSTRANPEYVWHCDCDDEGKVKMQFVQYEVHGIATHTCGYTRLRALKGLIDEGQTRLPE